MYNFDFFKGRKKDLNENKNPEINNELETQNSSSQTPIEKGANIDYKLHKENTIFVPELKPFAEKVLGLMKMGKSLQEICNNLFSKEKETANPEQIQIFNKAFSKFQKATHNLKIDEWNEEFNNIVNNNEILIKLPNGNRSLVYAIMQQPINEGYSEERRIEAFEDDVSLALLNRYCGALLTLIEDMKILAYNNMSIPKEIDILRETLRLKIKELGLKINDVALLEKLNNNGDVEVIDEVVSPLAKSDEQIVEVISYGVGGYGGSWIDKTRVIISK